MAGDEEPLTFAALYMRNRDAMLRAARAILRNHHDAEDAVSAAVVKIAFRFADGHIPDNPDAYLVQSARNAALDRRRAATRQQRGHSDELIGRRDRQSQVTSPSDVEEMADRTPDIVDQIIEQDRSHEISAAVQRTLTRLAQRESDMLSSLLAGRTRIEIGAAHSITGQRVGQLLKNPIADLLDELGVNMHGQERAGRQENDCKEISGGTRGGRTHAYQARLARAGTGHQGREVMMSDDRIAGERSPEVSNGENATNLACWGRP